MSTHLRFAPEILVRLGEELIPHPDLGVIELVRNAYDADATHCTVTLHNASQPGGTLVVADDGDGMTAESIREGFLLIGRSTKPTSPLTRKERRKVGEKGLGRLAALRLGRQVELFTRPREEPGVEHVLVIDWSAYESVRTVEEVELIVETRPTRKGPGTNLTVHRLRQGFDDAEMERLARAMRLLTGFFDDEDTGFQTTLNAPQFERVAEAVNRGFFDEHEYKLEAHLDEQGYARTVLYNWKGEEIVRGEHSDVAPDGPRGQLQAPLKYEAPSASFELWMFLLDKRSFELRGSRRQYTELRPWLKVVGGVHLFHRGLRVHPYGDSGFDWLDLNLMRSRSPELRPSTNNSVGRVSVDDPDDTLIPKTDRMGFQENLAFIELRSFARSATDWAARERKRIRDNNRTGNAATVRKEKDQAKRAVKEVLKDLQRFNPVQARQVSELVDTQERYIQALERDRLLYRSLATVGISTAVFAHESLSTAVGLGEDLEMLERRSRKLLDAETYEEKINSTLGRAQRSAASIHSFAKVPLRMLRRNKRRAAAVDVNEACREFAEMFGGYLQDWHIKLDLDLCDEPVCVLTPIADIESIYANLVINAAHAFARSNDPSGERTVLIRTRAEADRVVIDVADSGPGLTDVAVQDMWLPGEGGRSSDGTGLGLTIVKDIVADLHGKKTVLEEGELSAEIHGELGGAAFHIRLPRQAEGRDGQAATP
ncbi:sensor histidine kinase [Streptantibioticus ferralitis]|uniref:histidine kinase n=1 Tax=Streptantibioticus ferralitis TaxID=236510 RepID=A0ABT5Z9Y6_9ACTN|nr:sensor histidine kinase [Streptantibioticus ferralitis]MDF2260574.1 sensor histidine kinase [Streptantibioticus ferralitis]